MPSIITDLSEPIEVFRFGPSYRLMLMPKLSRGIEFLDLRMWNHWIADRNFHPGKNGIMIQKDKFLIIINKIKEILENEIRKPEICNTAPTSEIKKL